MNRFRASNGNVLCQSVKLWLLCPAKCKFQFNLDAPKTPANNFQTRRRISGRVVPIFRAITGRSQDQKPRRRRLTKTCVIDMCGGNFLMELLQLSFRPFPLDSVEKFAVSGKLGSQCPTRGSRLKTEVRHNLPTRL